MSYGRLLRYRHDSDADNNDKKTYTLYSNCRQYCFSILGLISAVLMLTWGRSHIVTSNDPTLVVSSKSCQSAQSSEPVSIYKNIYIIIGGEWPKNHPSLHLLPGSVPHDWFRAPLANTAASLKSLCLNICLDL